MVRSVEQGVWNSGPTGIGLEQLEGDEGSAGVLVDAEGEDFAQPGPADRGEELVVDGGEGVDVLVDLDEGARG